MLRIIRGLEVAVATVVATTGPVPEVAAAAGLKVRRVATRADTTTAAAAGGNGTCL
jgi:hypothetical protein